MPKPEEIQSQPWELKTAVLRVASDCGGGRTTEGFKLRTVSDKKKPRFPG